MLARPQKWKSLSCGSPIGQRQSFSVRSSKATPPASSRSTSAAASLMAAAIIFCCAAVALFFSPAAFFFSAGFLAAAVVLVAAVVLTAFFVSSFVFFLIGEDRPDRPRRCALPITAFRVTPPSSLAISAALRPSFHIFVSVSTLSSVQLIVPIILFCLPCLKHKDTAPTL